MYSALNPNPESQPGSSPPSGNLTSAVTVSRGASYLTIQTIITAVAQALAFAILARLITPSEVGILAILSLIQAFASALNGTAFSQAATTFIGELASDSREAASAVFYQSLRVTLLFSLPISAFVFLAAPSIASVLLGSMAQAGLFRALAIDLLVYSGALQVAIGTLLGMKTVQGGCHDRVCGHHTEAMLGCSSDNFHEKLSRSRDWLDFFRPRDARGLCGLHNSRARSAQEVFLVEEVDQLLLAAKHR